MPYGPRPPGRVRRPERHRPLSGVKAAAYIKGFGLAADGPGRRKYQNISDPQGTLRYARDPAPAYAQSLPGDPGGALHALR